MIKFKTYQEAMDKPVECKPQPKDASIRKTYAINKTTGELEETGTEDIQEIIDSNVDSILTVAQARLMPETDLQKNVAIFNQNRDKINEIQAYNDRMNDYRKEFGLSPLASTQEVLGAMKKYSNELAEAIASGVSNLGLNTGSQEEKKEENK